MATGFGVICDSLECFAMLSGILESVIGQADSESILSHFLFQFSLPSIILECGFDIDDLLLEASGRVILQESFFPVNMENLSAAKSTDCFAPEVMRGSVHDKVA